MKTTDLPRRTATRVRAYVRALERRRAAEERRFRLFADRAVSR